MNVLIQAHLPALVLSMIAASVAAQPPQYIARELASYPGSPGNFPGFRATGIGPDGEVVGAAENSALHWTTSGTTVLPGQYSFATAINDARIIVGSARGPGLSEAASWNNGSLQLLGTLGGNASQAWAINTHGQIVGHASTSGGDWHAFSWYNGAMSDLGSLPGMPESCALSVNAAGHVVGFASDQNHTRAFLYRDGTMSNLGVPPWTPVSSVVAQDINDAGDVVVAVGSHFSILTSRSFLLQSGSWIDLGTLYDLQTRANAINNAGTIVGETDGPGYGWVYSGGVMHDLNSLILGGLDARISSAVDINEQGQILTGALWVGPTHSELRFYVLTPVPSPGTVFVFIPVIALCRRSR